MPALRIVWIEFALCIFFAAYSGSRIYEIICSRTAENYRESVALQYIGEKVRQGDEAGNIRVVEINQISFGFMRMRAVYGSYLRQRTRIWNWVMEFVFWSVMGFGFISKIPF